MVDEKPTVFLVDDDDAVRDAVSMLLESAGLQARCFDSAQRFLDEYDATPGCLVLDVAMPGMTGLELQEKLNKSGIRIPIIFITGHGDVPMSVRAIKQGAVDFVEKPADDGELLQKIEQAIELDREFRGEDAQRNKVVDRFNRLTPREQQVMAEVAAGNSNKEIAINLDISHRTIEIHRARVMEKMGAGSLPDLIRMALICGVSVAGD